MFLVQLYVKSDRSKTECFKKCRNRSCRLLGKTVRKRHITQKLSYRKLWLCTDLSLELCLDWMCVLFGSLILCRWVLNLKLSALFEVSFWYLFLIHLIQEFFQQAVYTKRSNLRCFRKLVFNVGVVFLWIILFSNCNWTRRLTGCDSTYPNCIKFVGTGFTTVVLAGGTFSWSKAKLCFVPNWYEI